MDHKRQIRKLFTLEGLWSFRLGGGIWVLLLSLRGFSLAEIGLAEGIFHLVSLCGEVPSGLCADLLGRRRTLAASQFAFVVSALLMVFSNSLGGVCISLALNALGYNLASGTREAITYDSLVVAGEEGRYLHYSSWQNVIYRLGSGAATLCAPLALLLGFRGSYGADALLSALGVLLALSLTEPVVTGSQREREGALLRGLPARFRDYLKETGRFLRLSPRAVGLMLFNALVGALATLLGFYLQPSLSAAGAPAALLGPLLLGAGLGGAAGARLAPFLHRLPYRTAGAVCTLGVGAGFLLTATGLYPVMALGGFLAAASDDCIQTLTDARLNAAFPSDQRATLISVSSMCFSLVMAVLSPLVGSLVS